MTTSFTIDVTLGTEAPGSWTRLEDLRLGSKQLDRVVALVEARVADGGLLL